MVGAKTTQKQRAPRSSKQRSVPAKTKRAELLELAGVFEAAELLGISKWAITNYRSRPPGKYDRRPPFPEPVALLKCGPIWTRQQLLEWRKEWDRREKLARHPDFTRCKTPQDALKIMRQARRSAGPWNP